MSIYQSIYLSVYQSVYPSIHLSIYLEVVENDTSGYQTNSNQVKILPREYVWNHLLDSKKLIKHFLGSFYLNHVTAKIIFLAKFKKEIEHFCHIIWKSHKISISSFQTTKSTKSEKSLGRGRGGGGKRLDKG